MALRINGIGGKYIIPNVLSNIYRYTAFDGPVLKYRATTKDGKVEEKSINVKKIIDSAWIFITKHAATHKPCNEYFKTLPRKKTLREILTEGDITLHSLEPKGQHTIEHLPDANTAGRDIGISPYLLIVDPDGLAATLIHELAHVGGASTNPDPGNPTSIAAEKALQFCLCKKRFRPEALGSIQIIEPRGAGDSRIV